jgi:Cdc6-like AAA superfamily ATPase
LVLIAGTGKTNLTSRVIDKIQSDLKKGPNHEGLAFFYFNRNESERQKPLSVLRSFVQQLSTPFNEEHSSSSLQKRLKKFYLEKRQTASEPTISECEGLILESVNTYPKTTLILDAVDECDKSNRSDLIEIFKNLLAHASRPVKNFISSRPDDDIKEGFKSGANIEIRAADNQDDISKFIRSEITKHPRWKRMFPEDQKVIIETLQARSRGM